MPTSSLVTVAQSLTKQCKPNSLPYYVNLRRSLYSYCNEPAHPVHDKQPKWMSPEEAMQFVKSGDEVFVQGAAATPRILVPALAEHGKKNKLKDVKVHHIHTEGKGEYLDPDCKGIFRSNSLFTGSNCRKPIEEGRADFTPIFLGDIPQLFFRGIIKPNVSLVQVTPADQHGYHSLGTSVDVVRAALQHSKYIVGQVNSRLPRTQGDALIHTSHFDALVKGEIELPEHQPPKLGDVENAIGKHIADNLVEDGATLQMGIGAIPDAVLAQLTNHKDLGVHSEMFSDGLVNLVKTGAVTNRLKKICTGRILASFAVGTRSLFDFMNDNPFLVMKTIDFVNKEFNIAQNPKVTAINSCIEVDLVGQVCSDSIGTRVYSGFGGQVDFIRGAALGLDGKGKPILAMPSTTKKGESKIVPFLKQGAGVVSTRAHAHYIVTEYGIAELFGRNYRQRAYALIQISHPDHREALEKAAFERLKCMPSPN